MKTFKLLHPAKRSPRGNSIIYECVRLQRQGKCSQSVLLVRTHCKLNVKAHSAEKWCPGLWVPLTTQHQHLPNHFCPHCSFSSTLRFSLTHAIVHVRSTQRLNASCSPHRAYYLLLFFPPLVYHGWFAGAARLAWIRVQCREMIARVVH